MHVPVPKPMPCCSCRTTTSSDTSIKTGVRMDDDTFKDFLVIIIVVRSLRSFVRSFVCLFFWVDDGDRDVDGS